MKPLSSVLALLSSCLLVTLAAIDARAADADAAPPPGMATVTLIYANGYGYHACVTMTLDDRPAALLCPAEYASVTLPPGHHRLLGMGLDVHMNNPGLMHPIGLEFDVPAGDTRYIELATSYRLDRVRRVSSTWWGFEPLVADVARFKMAKLSESFPVRELHR